MDDSISPLHAQVLLTTPCQYLWIPGGVPEAGQATDQLLRGPLTAHVMQPAPRPGRLWMPEAREPRVAHLPDKARAQRLCDGG